MGCCHGCGGQGLQTPLVLTGSACGDGDSESDGYIDDDFDIDCRSPTQMRDCEREEKNGV